MSLVLSPSLTTEKFNPHRYGIKKQACRLSEEIPTGRHVFLRILYFQCLEHIEHEKSYYTIDFQEKIRYIKIYVLYKEIGIWCSNVFSCSDFARGDALEKHSSEHLSQSDTQEDTPLRRAVDVPCNTWKCRRDLLHKVLLRIWF